MTSTIQSVGRTFETLEYMAARGTDTGVSEIAAAIGLPLPTVHRILQTLLELGYVHRNERHRYSLSVRLIPLGVAAQRAVQDSLGPLIAQAAEAAGESVSAEMSSPVGVLRVARADPPGRSTSADTEAGVGAVPGATGIELVATAVGRALLAGMAPDDLRAALDPATSRARHGAPITRPSIVAIENALHEVEATRRCGFTVDRPTTGQAAPGTTTVAVACRVPHWPRTTLALTLSYPGDRPHLVSITEAVAALTAAATRFEEPTKPPTPYGGGGHHHPTQRGLS